VQAARLRLKIDSGTPVPSPLRTFMDRVSAQSPFVDEDRALEHELRALTARIAACDLLQDYRGGSNT
jgi:histidine ammonia-lyase